MWSVRTWTCGVLSSVGCSSAGQRVSGVQRAGEEAAEWPGSCDVSAPPAGAAERCAPDEPGAPRLQDPRAAGGLTIQCGEFLFQGFWKVHWTKSVTFYSRLSLMFCKLLLVNFSSSKKKKKKNLQFKRISERSWYTMWYFFPRLEKCTFSAFLQIVTWKLQRNKCSLNVRVVCWRFAERDFPHNDLTQRQARACPELFDWVLFRNMEISSVKNVLKLLLYVQ